MVKRLPPELRKELENLAQYEGRILDGLKDPELSKLFVVDPAAALSRMKLTLSPLLRKRLRPNPAALEEVLRARGFRTTSGQVVSPRVRIRFTGSREE